MDKSKRHLSIETERFLASFFYFNIIKRLNNEFDLFYILKENALNETLATLSSHALRMFLKVSFFIFIWLFKREESERSLNVFKQRSFN